MDGTCSMRGRNEKCVLFFVDAGVDGKIIFEWILGKLSGRM
jgi:hypothetical protein